MKTDDQSGYGNSKSMMENAKTSLLKNKRILEEVDKKLVSFKKDEGNSLLDETQIRE
jgi:hypothetical protein